MFHSHHFERTSSFKRLGFSARVWRCLERAERGHEALLPANQREILRAIGQARQTLMIASDEVILSILEKNPLAIRLSRPRKGTIDQYGLLAVLPLNAAGFDAVMGGQFSGLEPDPDWVCTPNEEPEAVYVWLVHMPGTFGRCLGAIGQAFDSIMTEPKPLFSKATNRHSLRLHQQAGFMHARSFFPRCRDDLQIIFPEQPIQAADRNAITVRIARTVEDIFKVFSVRSATYIAEQYCFYDEEFDGNDFCSTQFLGGVDKLVDVRLGG